MQERILSRTIIVRYIVSQKMSHKLMRICSGIIVSATRGIARGDDPLPRRQPFRRGGLQEFAAGRPERLEATACCG